MKHRRNFFFIQVAALSLLFLLAACHLPRRLPVSSLPAGPSPTWTLPTSYEQCAWVWASQSLPELSTEVQTALETAGLKNVTVYADAYGENCISARTGEVLHFSAMQTDFHIAVEVETLADREHLGNLLEQILVVLDDFPPGVTPGPNPGYIGVNFIAGAEELNLWFSRLDGEAARAQGLRGAALVEELSNR